MCIIDSFCIDELDLDDNSIGEMLRCIERMGISSVEYFCEEFVFACFDEVCEEFPNNTQEQNESISQQRFEDLSQ